MRPEFADLSIPEGFEKRLETVPGDATGLNAVAHLPLRRYEYRR
jgi:hypothetical protein